jgi:hypothetical protein
LKDKQLLPYIKEAEKKWSFLYSFNLKTIRDIFVFVAREPISKKNLYLKMEENIIKPPKIKWSDDKNKKVDRLKLEYLHTCTFLDLVSQDKTNNLLTVTFEDFKEEKEILIRENENRNFYSESESIELNNAEKKAIIPIILSYHRAKEYLWWFTDSANKKISEINLEYVSNFGKPFYLKKDSGSKGAREMFRLIDNQEWLIPFEEKEKKGKIILENDYSRLVTSVLPNWFSDLDIINRIPIIKEFEFKTGNWEMHYPISQVNLTVDEFELFIEKKFVDKRKSYNAIWIPMIIYETILEYRLSVKMIKELVIKIYEQKKPKYMMERSSFEVLRYSAESQKNKGNIHQELFIIYKEFLRTFLIINN